MFWLLPKSIFITFLLCSHDSLMSLLSFPWTLTSFISQGLCICYSLSLDTFSCLAPSYHAGFSSEKPFLTTLSKEATLKQYITFIEYSYSISHITLIYMKLSCLFAYYPSSCQRIQGPQEYTKCLEQSVVHNCCLVIKLTFFSLILSFSG